jgi:hypothetical protein
MPAALLPAATRFFSADSMPLLYIFPIFDDIFLSLPLIHCRRPPFRRYFRHIYALPLRQRQRR